MFQSNQKIAGYVYVALNITKTENTYKIGKTTKKPEKRASKLNYDPDDFTIVYFKPFHNHHKAETLVHDALAEFRQKAYKEIFIAPLEKIKDAIDRIYQEDVEKHGREAVVIHDENSTTIGYVDNPNSGIINVALTGSSPYPAHPYQKDAQSKLSKSFLKKESERVSGILMIPTGGGKTFTATEWILKHWISAGKRVVWIAHRHELLNQAFKTFTKNAYPNLLAKKETIKYIIISGKHDSLSNLTKDHELIFASVGSLSNNPQLLTEKVIKPNELQEMLLVIDEAHHASAKSYRKVIDELQNNVEGLKILGLTATPYRSEDFRKKKDKYEEDIEGVKKLKSELGKVFKDNILYSISLQKLINEGFLAKPQFIDKNTNVEIKLELTEEEIAKIEKLDISANKKLEEILIAAKRNKFIVEEYVKDKEQYKYGKTLFFAVNQKHALELHNLLRNKGVKSNYLISGKVADETEILSNEEKIEKFRNNEYEALVNVNILTEGTDLPDVKTIFLTRPTTSSILMTQMIGRALRGERAGGTAESYIVSFIDNYEDKIRFIKPEQLFISENTDFTDTNSKITQTQMVKLISLLKIAEFQKATEVSTDTNDLIGLPFLSRIPVGNYFLHFLNEETEEEEFDHVFVFEHLKQNFEGCVKDLPKIFENIRFDSTNDVDFHWLTEQIFQAYFKGCENTLGFEMEYITNIARYYATCGLIPKYIPLQEREKYDIDRIAQQIHESNGKRPDLINQLWDSASDEIKLFLNANRQIFIRLILDALMKLDFPDDFKNNSLIEPTTTFDKQRKRIDNMSNLVRKNKTVEVENTVVVSANEENIAEVFNPDETGKGILEEETTETQAIFEELLIPESRSKKIIVRVEIRGTGGKKFVFKKRGEEICDLYIKYQTGETETISYKAPFAGIIVFKTPQFDSFKSGEVFAHIVKADGKTKAKRIVYIFGSYKSYYFDAFLDSKTFKVTYKGIEYKTPTTAAKVASTIQEGINGYDFWHYIDWDTESLKKIKELRKGNKI